MAYIGYNKDIELPSGAVAGYHVIQRVTGTFPEGELRVDMVIESYLTKEAYDAQKPALEINTYKVENGNALSALSNAADGLLLSLSAFSGAQKG